MAATLRELLQRLANELTSASGPFDESLLVRAPAALRPQILGGSKFAPAEPVRFDSTRGGVGETTSAPTMAEPISMKFVPATHSTIPESETVPDPSVLRTTNDVPTLEAVPVEAGASPTFERRWQQLEEEWARGLEQLTEMFRRTFVPRNELANLIDRIRDLECAQILRGRM